MSNQQQLREKVFSLFVSNENFCQEEYGSKMVNCKDIKASLQKELGGPGCSSCKKSSIYSKYRQIIYAKMIQIGL